MPTASGQLILSDYDQELIDAGFDSITQDRRFRWINFGYRRVANKYPWLWEEATVDVVMNPGDFALDFVTDVPDFRSLDFVYVVTANHERRLRAEDYEKFHDVWAPMNLTLTAHQAEPDRYFVADNQLYILPPPNAQRTIRVKYHRRVPDLTKVAQVPVTPQYLDEGILTAVFAHAHKRVHELQLAGAAEADLQDWFDQLRQDDEWVDVNTQERVEPDNTWL